MKVLVYQSMYAGVLITTENGMPVNGVGRHFHRHMVFKFNGKVNRAVTFCILSSSFTINTAFQIYFAADFD